MSSVDPEILRLRQELDQLDGDLVAAMARRQAIVAEIGRRKQAVGRQLRDYARERQVLDGVRRRAASAGLDPALAEDVLKRLIEASLSKQERDRIRQSNQGGGRRALVVGGAGKMGAWFADFLDAQDYRVEIVDPGAVPESSAYSRHVELTAENAAVDLIVLATPLAACGPTLRALAGLGTQALVIDIASLKTPLLAALAEADAAGLRLCSVHPMYGPGVTLLAGRHILLMQVGAQADALAEARALFSVTSAELVELPLADHDRLVAYVLGLSHWLNLGFVRALAGSGADAPHLARLSSTTFDRQLAVSRQVNGENPALYYEIQALNQHRELAWDSLSRALAELRRVVEQGDSPAFADIMADNRHWLGLSEQVRT